MGVSLHFRPLRAAPDEDWASRDGRGKDGSKLERQEPYVYVNVK